MSRSEPVFAAKGEGAWLVDVEGKKLLDFANGGTLPLGYTAWPKTGDSPSERAAAQELQSLILQATGALLVAATVWGAHELGRASATTRGRPASGRHREPVGECGRDVTGRGGNARVLLRNRAASSDVFTASAQ